MRARLAILALVAFVVLDILLVMFAFRHAAGQAPQASGQPTRGISSTPDPSPTSEASPSSSADVAAGPTYLDVSADGTILRATRGDCDTRLAPVVGVSTDQGASFKERAVKDLSEVLRTEVESDGSMWIIGRTGGCAVARWTSTNDGRSWSQQAGAGGSWYLAPSPTQRAVFAPGGRRRTPCVPVSLSTMDADVIRLLCEDGKVLGTSDGGDSWVTLGRLDGAVSIRFTAPGDGVAVAVRDDCDAAVMETSDGGTNWSQQTCLDGTEPRAVGAAGDLVVAQVDDRLDVSSDGGRTWPGANS